MSELKQSAQAVQQALDDKGLELKVVELPSSTRSAQDAANSIGCELGQIVKSLIFKGASSGDPILVLASGPNQVDTQKVSQIVNETIEKADATFVREKTGFAIGGIPPIGHTQEITTIIDQDLTNWETLWAAAGTPNAVFQLKSENLSDLTTGTFADIKT